MVVNEQSGDITFRNLIKKDFGLYYCVAENKHGSSVSSFVKILEAGKKSALQNNEYVIRESMTTNVLAIWPDSARVSVPRFSRLNSVCVT